MFRFLTTTICTRTGFNKLAVLCGVGILLFPVVAKASENNVVYEAKVNPDSLYSYKLEGHDENWLEASGGTEASYANLPAGDYVFRVRASSHDGLWRDDGISFTMQVQPEPWLSKWAYLAYITLGGLLLAFLLRVYFFKLRKASRYRALLEEKVRIRTAELEKANQQLLDASVTDQLTGLHNRRYVHNVIDTQCAQILREGEKAMLAKRPADEIPRLFCLMFDLDGFKPINDTYGHDAGDQIICQVSKLLARWCRKSDTVIRWGGDEFLVIGRIEHVNEINLLAERLRVELVNHGFDIGLKQRIHLSCSIGYGLFPFSTRFPDMFSWDQVQVIADRALYHSKGAGKDYWAGIVSTESQPPVTLVNTLVTHLEQSIEDGHVIIDEVTKKNNNPKREIIDEFRQVKAS